MNNIDYTEIERPVEPAFANEDPEGWVDVVVDQLELKGE